MYISRLTLIPSSVWRTWQWVDRRHSGTRHHDAPANDWERPRHSRTWQALAVVWQREETAHWCPGVRSMLTVYKTYMCSECGWYEYRGLTATVEPFLPTPWLTMIWNANPMFTRHIKMVPIHTASLSVTPSTGTWDREVSNLKGGGYLPWIPILLAPVCLPPAISPSDQIGPLWHQCWRGGTFTV